MSDDTTQGSFLRAFDALREQLKTEFVDVETLRNQLLEARIKNDQLTAELERVKGAQLISSSILGRVSASYGW